MHSALKWNKWVTCLVMTLAILDAHWALGQSNATMTTDPGADITVVVEIEVASIFGSDSKEDQSTATVTGSASVTLFPTDPPFTHCRIHSLRMEVGQIDLEYLIFFFQINVTFTDLTIESVEPFDGAIDAGAHLVVPVAPMRISGSAHMVIPSLTVDDVLDVDAGSLAGLTGMLGGGDGTVLMGGIALPAVDWVVPADTLPSGITSLNVHVVTDPSRILFRGPYTPTPLGDSNADNVVDLRDWKDLVLCLDPANALTNIICPVFYFDQDNDVDLRDAADFLLELSSP